MFFANQPKDQEKHEMIGKALGFLEKFLENETYVAGKTMTVADLSLLATVTSLDVSSFEMLSQLRILNIEFLLIA